MKLKKIFIGLFIIFVLIILYSSYKLTTFNLFENENKVIQEIRIPNEKYMLKIYYIPSNATTQSYIQIRKLENNKEEVIKSFERYNFLNKFEILHKDSLRLFVSDTSFTNPPIDKISIKLPNSKF
jgi:hypothetical protein